MLVINKKGFVYHASKTWKIKLTKEEALNQIHRGKRRLLRDGGNGDNEGGGDDLAKKKRITNPEIRSWMDPPTFPPCSSACSGEFELLFLKKKFIITN